MAKTTQNERVLRHLKTYGSITPIEALSEYGIFGESTHYASYKLIEG